MKAWLALALTLPLLAVGSGAVATANPTVPPQNGLIAVSSSLDGRVHIVDPRSGSQSVVPGTERAGDAVWSPDGTTLAMDDLTESAGFGVYTIKPDGTDRRLVLRDADSPSWSPDGQWLVVRREKLEWSEPQLVVVNADGTEERVLPLKGVPVANYLSAPAWSPDGSLIAFVAGDERVYLITPDGAKVRALDVKGAGPLSWSPDSSRLAFERIVDPKGAAREVVVVLELASGKETVLTGEQNGAVTPAWSPDGTQLAFISRSIESTGPPELSHFELWLMAPDGTAAKQLIKGEVFGAPSWARAVEPTAEPADEVPAPKPETTPPGVRDESSSTTKPTKPDVAPAPRPVPLARNAAPTGAIAVRGSNAIYLVDPEGAAVHKVPDTADMIAPAWSPDGSQLAVERIGKDGSSSIYTIRPDGTQPQLVLKNASAPTWSPAGDRIFVVRNECSTPCEPEDDEANVRYSVRPDGGGLQRVDLEQADLRDPRELAWRGDGSPIWFFEDGSVDGPGTFDTAAAAWSPDESRIAFIGALGPTDDEASVDTITAGLWIVSAEGGTPQLLLKGASGWPSWPRDGR